jgi:hypothetical protein
MLAFFFAEGFPLAGFGKPTLHQQKGRHNDLPFFFVAEIA